MLRSQLRLANLHHLLPQLLSLAPCPLSGDACATIATPDHVFSCSCPSSSCRVFSYATASSFTSAALPLCSAYHAARYSRVAHSAKTCSSPGRRSTAVLACTKSGAHTAQFSHTPIRDAALKSLTNCCFYCSSFPLATSHMRVASCTSACISKPELSVLTETKQKLHSVMTSF